MNEMQRSLGQEILKEFDRMKGHRVNWDTYWEDLAEYFIPRKDNVYGYKIEGERKHNRLYDSTSIQACELLASSLHGMLTNPSSVWFDLSTGNTQLDNKKEVRQYINYWKATVDHISISAAHNWTGDMDLSRGFSMAFLRDPCRLIWTDTVIFYNGDVPLCCNDYEGKAILGNVKSSSIKDIWSGRTLADLRRLHAERRFRDTVVCENCDYNYHHKSNWWVTR